MSGSKRKPLNEISAEEKTEKGKGKSVSWFVAVSIAHSDTFDFNLSIKPSGILVGPIA